MISTKVFSILVLIPSKQGGLDHEKLIKPEDFVHESLVGMAAAHRLLKVHFDPKFVYRADAPVQGKVAIISGGQRS